MRPIAAPDVVATAPAVASEPTGASNPFGALLVDLRSRSTQVSFAESFPLGPDFELIPPEQPDNVRSTAMSAISQFGERAPLPPGRPTELGSPASRGSLIGPRHLAQQSRKTALPATASDSRTFFETFFGVAPQSSGPALAYAAPETGVLNDAQSVTSGPAPRYDRWTAVYDISAHTVYLPNGTKLEAHSGLGSRIDDPRYVHERMRGATPPHIYELEPRERLFHGVQALRLKPIGGESNIFGRAGLLAHTYMLGPKGDSNGCVSFKNYNAFLQAYKNGEIKRLVVVARLD